MPPQAGHGMDGPLPQGGRVNKETGKCMDPVWYDNSAAWMLSQIPSFKDLSRPIHGAQPCMALQMPEGPKPPRRPIRRPLQLDNNYGHEVM